MLNKCYCVSLLMKNDVERLISFVRSHSYLIEAVEVTLSSHLNIHVSLACFCFNDIFPFSKQKLMEMFILPLHVLVPTLQCWQVRVSSSFQIEGYSSLKVASLHRCYSFNEEQLAKAAFRVVDSFLNLHRHAKECVSYFLIYESLNSSC